MQELLNKSITDQKLIYKGSVKDIFEIQNNSNELIFAFSNRYSIFDWGEMPDAIPDKGQTLALFSHFSFEFLKSVMPNHSLGLVDSLANPITHLMPTPFLKVKKVKVKKPLKESTKEGILYKYDAYKNKSELCLFPVEVIFRFGVPEGSSLVGRLEKLKKMDPQAYQQKLIELGLPQRPQSGDRFENPIIEFTTKLEPTDRFLRETDVCQMTSVNQFQLNHLKNLTQKCALKLKEFLEQHSIQLWDGKFEFSYLENQNGEIEFSLIDAIGPDELRLTFDQIPLSKEVLRKYYKNSLWAQQLSKVKEEALALQIENWQNYCIEKYKLQPEPLPPDLLLLISNMYKSLVNLMSQRAMKIKIFSDVEDIQLVSQKIKERIL